MLTSSRTHLLYLLVVFSFLLCASTTSTSCPSHDEILCHLGRRLSDGSSIQQSNAANPRWSEYDAPTAMFIVNVASEEDVATTVRYCNHHNITFLAQNGANGWAETFELGACGLIINLSGLQDISFNSERTEAFIQGGVQVKQMVDAAYAVDARFANPSCNCLGFLGTALGGGVTRSSGLYGWIVDQILSMNVVTASGTQLHVSRNNHEDLFWALCGAGPNFGIVTSAVIKLYPILPAENIAWQGPVVFSADKLEALIQAMNDLELKPHMQIDLLIAPGSPSSHAPVITVWPFYLGSATDAEEAFSSILSMEPISRNTTVMAYPQWNDWSGAFCTKGGRKPVYGISTATLDPKAVSASYRAFSTFVASDPAAFAYSAILLEKYSTGKAESIGAAASSFPWRNLPYHSVIIPWYMDAKDDVKATAFGENVRALLSEQEDGESRTMTYINFAHGDESLETIYGDNLPRLRTLKKRYDPLNRFSQWFPIE